MQPRRRLNIDRQRPNLLSLGSGNEGLFWGLLFAQSPQFVLEYVPSRTILLFHMLCPKLSPSQLYRWAKGAETLHLAMETFIQGRHQSIRFVFVMGQSKWLIAPKKKKKNLGKQPPSHELKHEYTTIVQYMPILCFPCISNLTQAKSNDEKFQQHNLYEGDGVGSNFFLFGAGGGNYQCFQVLLESKGEIVLFKIKLESKLRVLSCLKQVQSF